MRILERLRQGGAQLVHVVASRLQDRDTRAAAYEALVEQVRNENEYLCTQLSQALGQNGIHTHTGRRTTMRSSR